MAGVNTLEQGVWVAHELYQGDKRGFAKKSVDKAINGGLTIVQKSTPFTVGATLGIVALTELTLGAAAPLLAIDIGGSFVAGKLKERRENNGLTQDMHVVYDSRQAAMHEQTIESGNGVIFHIKHIAERALQQVSLKTLQPAQ